MSFSSSVCHGVLVSLPEHGHFSIVNHQWLHRYWLKNVINNRPIHVAIIVQLKTMRTEVSVAMLFSEKEQFTTFCDFPIIP